MRKGWIRKIGIAILSIGAVAAVVEVVAAVRIRRLRTERAHLGDRLYTETRGQGAPVIFLAGLPATTHFWQGRFDPLAKTRRLIFVDNLGFGRSPLPKVEYTLEDHLGALRRTLVAQGATRRVTFIAHSFGTLNPILARQACKLHEATLSPALARLVPLFVPDTPPEVAREGLLHTWRSFDGTFRHVVLAKPIGIPLQRIGPKVTFIHGRADHITSLERVQALAAATGARVLVTEDDHLSYPARSSDAILAEIRQTN